MKNNFFYKLHDASFDQARAIEEKIAPESFFFIWMFCQSLTHLHLNLSI